MNEKCYVVVQEMVTDTLEYSGAREDHDVLAVAKTKEKAFELIQQYSENAFSSYRPESGVTKTIECDGWRVMVESECDLITTYCIEFDLQ